MREKEIKNMTTQELIAYLETSIEAERRKKIIQILDKEIDDYYKKINEINNRRK